MSRKVLHPGIFVWLGVRSILEVLLLHLVQKGSRDTCRKRFRFYLFCKYFQPLMLFLLL